MKKFRNPVSLWTGLDPEKRSRIATVAGWAVAVFAVYTLLAVCSYFFTWKQDQSLLTDPSMMDQSVQVHNLASKAGFKWSHFLVGNCFGVAALALVVFLGILAWRLIRKDRSVPLLKSFIACFSGAILFSVILGFIGPLAGLSQAFGNGLGGSCGASVAGWSVNLVGTIVTALSLILLTAGWIWWLSKDLIPAMRFPKREPEEEQPQDEDIVPAVAEVMEPAPKPRRERPSTPPTGPVVVDVKDPFPTGEEPATDGSFEIVTDGTLDAKVDEELPRINNRDDLPKFKFPSLDLLGDYLSGRHEVSPDELERNNLKIRTTLSNYKIQVKDVKAIVGPTVTLYKVYPAPGVKIAAIKSLQEDIAMSLNARGVRVVTLPDSVGIEVANDKPSIVPLKSLLNDPAFRESKADLPVAIGYTITQQVKVFDLADAPHLLVAGATKQGKSVGLNVIVSSLLYSKHPSELKFVFIDPKMVEFSAYNQLLYHYLAVLPSASDEQEEMDRAIVKNAKDAGAVLKSLCVEMDQRYELLSKAGVNNLKRYNDKFRDRHLLPTEGHRFLPYIVTIIDEYADLTMSTGAGPESKALARSITNSVIRLAQKGRAAGLHVILATQRPTVDVVTGLIKTNFPTRIAFRVTSRVDSMTILDNPGADKLIGKGDMLIYSGIEMERVQCGYVDGDEVQAITSFIGEQRGWKRSYNTPCYLPEPEVEGGDEDGGGMIDMKNIDERFEEAARMVVMTQRGSTSDLQRKLGMGYAKAGRVMDQLEAAGVVGPQQGSKPREVLVKDFSELDGILAHFLNK